MLRRAAQRVRRSRAARVAARLGLFARGVFYLVLAYLAAAVAGGWGGAGPVNAHGALTAVGSTPVGLLALVAAAVGFAAFGVVRLAGAYADRRVAGLRRLTTAGQALVYLAMGVATTSFLLGRRSTGSSRQEDSTAAVLASSLPGRVVLAVVGAVVVGVCVWQLVLVARGGYADSLRTWRLPERARRPADAVGRAGIAARAVAVLPAGALLVMAAVQRRPSDAKDLDQILEALVHRPYGDVAVWCLAGGLALFAAYSFLEVPLRRVEAGD